MTSFKPKIYFPSFNPSPTPPVYYDTRGWGDAYNGGVGITGAGLSVPMFFAQWQDMWDHITATENLTTPIWVIYTGPDVDFGVYTLRTRTGVENKRITASSGQRLMNMTIFMQSWKNCVWENWDHHDSQDDLITIRTCEGIWIRHCRLYANEFNTDGTTDGCIDIVVGSDYIAVTDCLFIDANKASLVGSSDAAFDTDRGKLRVSFLRNDFADVVQRIPFVRYGKIGLHHNRVRTSVIPYLDGGSKIIQIGVESQVYSIRNSYNRGRWLFSFEGGDLDGGVISEEDYIGEFLANTTAIGSSNVIWNPHTEPNYEFDRNLSRIQGDLYVQNWAGPKLHQKQPIF